MFLAQILIMGVMLTSCLNSDDGESMYDNGCLAKVIYASEYGGAVFKDVAGNTYNASAKSVSDLVSNGASFSNVEMALIYYKWAKDENGNQLTPPNWNASTPQTYEVDLVFFQSVPTSSVEKVNTVEEIEAREYETAPIGIVNMSDDNGNTVKFDFYGDDPILCMNLYWFLTNGEDEFKMHSIRLAYVSNELTSDATELRFYLCHDIFVEQFGYEPFKLSNNAIQTQLLSFDCQVFKSINVFAIFAIKKRKDYEKNKFHNKCLCF